MESEGEDDAGIGIYTTDLLLLSQNVFCIHQLAYLLRYMDENIASGR